ncbi:hypothetical protein Tco_0409982 [Tanacetum coccineum]
MDIIHKLQGTNSKGTSQIPQQRPLSLSSLQQLTRSRDTHEKSWRKNYKHVDPKKKPPEVLASKGKTNIFQFHFNTLANITDFTLDDVFDINTADQSTSSSAEQRDKGTPLPTALPVREQEQADKGKEKYTVKQGDKGTPPPSHTALHDQRRTKNKPKKQKKIPQRGPSSRNHPPT